MSKKTVTNLLSGADLSDSVMAGIEKVAGLVKRTLGPGGQPIIIHRDGKDPYGNPLKPLVTKDGVTVARAIRNLPNVHENNVAQVVIGVAEKTNEEAGDGPQPLYSKVLTPTGWIEMSDVRVGMELCGVNQTYQTVVGVYPKGSKEVVEVEFSDCRVVECCKDHLWHVTSNTAHCAKTEIKTTEQIREDFVRYDSKGDRRFKYCVPKTSVEFKSSLTHSDIDPYLMGVLLGDGNLSASGSIELSLGLKKKHIIDRIKLHEGIVSRISYVGDKDYFSVKFNGKTHEGKAMSNLLEEVGLLGTVSSTKFIPDKYLYSSIEDRSALLQGLLDTDGCFNSSGLFEFSTVSDKLRDGFLELARSLGVYAHSWNSNTLKRKEDDEAYFMVPIHRICQLKEYEHGNKIVDVRPTGKFTEMQCIKVSNSDNLYITDNYIVTHNTTTATVLAEAIYRESLKRIRTGKEPQILYNELRKAGDAVADKLKSMAIEVKTNQEIVNVASISANNDQEIGEVIAAAIDAVGEDGVITLQEGSSRETKLEIVEGFRIDRGIIHPDFINNQGSGECCLDNTGVLVYNGVLDDWQKLANLLMKLTKNFEDTDQKLFIIANDVEQSVINFLGINRRKLNLNLGVIKGPDATNIRTEMMTDIATLLGANLIGDGRKSLDAIEHEFGADGTVVKSDLGFAKRIESGRFFTTIYGGAGEISEVEKRIEDLKELRKTAFSPYDLNRINQRIACLSNGVAVISCGGDTSVEIKEKKDRVEDALNATRAAIQTGIVAGGGIALIRARQALKVEGAIQTDGEAVLFEALELPLRTIIQNVGERPDVIIHQVLNFGGVTPMNTDHHGYDARRNAYCNMIDCGIIDPVKVVESALRNAISIAGLLTTCGGSIVDSETITEDE